MKFGFVAKYRGAWPVLMMCEALDVSRSGFYAWLTRPRSQHSLDDEALAEQARQSFLNSDRTYGARRVWRDVLEMGSRCGLHRMERVMRKEGLRARPRRRGLPVDRGARSSAAIAPNILDREFTAVAPNQTWVTSMQAQMSAQRVTDALMMATWRRGRWTASSRRARPKGRTARTTAPGITPKPPCSITSRDDGNTATKVERG